MPITGKEMLRRFKTEGWIVLRQNGSHIIVGYGQQRATIPVHGNKDLKPGTEKSLLKQLKTTGKEE
jgi:predicted RNA binding protein YcfA (HicA-like mRNA interferase family)